MPGPAVHALAALVPNREVHAPVPPSVVSPDLQPTRISAYGQLCRLAETVGVRAVPGHLYGQYGPIGAQCMCLRRSSTGAPVVSSVRTSSTHTNRLRRRLTVSPDRSSSSNHPAWSRRAAANGPYASAAPASGADSPGCAKASAALAQRSSASLVVADAGLVGDQDELRLACPRAGRGGRHGIPLGGPPGHRQRPYRMRQCPRRGEWCRYRRSPRPAVDLRSQFPQA